MSPHDIPYRWVRDTLAAQLKQWMQQMGWRVAGAGGCLSVMAPHMWRKAWGMQLGGGDGKAMAEADDSTAIGSIAIVNAHQIEGVWCDKAGIASGVLKRVM